MTVRLYRSTDASAPVLTGSAGALITVLDAVLVGTVGVAYGSTPSAGWTKAFSSTNRAAYRMATSGNTGFYLNVDDGAGPASAREANMTGFETMSAFGVGTGQFPTIGQLNFGTTPAGCVVIRKSNTADSVARPWIIVADGSVFYMFIESGDFTNPPGCMSFAFGDFFSYKPSDAYRCMILGRNAFNSNAPGNDPLHGTAHPASNFLTTRQPGQYLARHWSGVGGSVDFGKHWNSLPMGAINAYGDTFGTGSLSQGNPTIIMGNSNTNASMPMTPNGPDGNYLMSPIWIHHHSAIRGYFKGLWAILHSLPFQHGDTMSGVGNMVGKSFIFQMINGQVSNVQSRGLATIEYSDTWS